MRSVDIATLALPLALSLLAGAASAQAVSLSGAMGDRALLIIDGAPKTLATGATHNGVKLIVVNANEATVEIKGQRVRLPLGGAQVNLGGAASDGVGTRIVLTANSGGHYVTNGTVNGAAIMFMVDTGATSIALSQADAERMRIDYKTGPLAYVNTANGAVPVHRTTLRTVRIGDVQVYDVDAVVLPSSMPYALLGNSFLRRFQMKQENDRMTLERRP